MLLVNLQNFFEVIKKYTYNPAVSQIQTDLLNNANVTFPNAILDAAGQASVWKARLNQAGTAAPTLTNTFRNSNGAVPVLARTGVGIYTIAGLTTTALKPKTFVDAVMGGAGNVQINVIAADLVEIRTYNAAGALTDALLVDACITVEVYQ